MLFCWIILLYVSRVFPNKSELYGLLAQFSKCLIRKTIYTLDFSLIESVDGDGPLHEGAGDARAALRQAATRSRNCHKIRRLEKAQFGLPSIFPHGHSLFHILKNLACLMKFCFLYNFNIGTFSNPSIKHLNFPILAFMFNFRQS